MNLYDIDLEYKEIQEIIEENEGIIPEDLEKKFEEVCSDRTKKIENIIKFIKNLELYSKTAKHEAERLQDKSKSAQKKADYFRNLLTIVLGEGNKWKSSIASVSWGSSSSVEITDAKLIPVNYTKSVTEVKIDKIAIKAAINSSIDVPGAKLNTSKFIKIS